jgi:hypothetical protein
VATDEPQDPPVISTPGTDAPDGAQPPNEEQVTGAPVIDFQDRTRRTAGRVHVPEDLRLPETKLAEKLTTHQLRERRRERRRLAYQLWLQDLPYVEIGRQLGIASSTADLYVRSYTALIDKPRERSVQASRAKHVAQLALGKRTMMSLVMDTRTYAKDRIAAFTAYVQATAEQARLNGEHMPIKVASTTPDGEQWAPLAMQVLRGMSDEELAIARKLASAQLVPEDPAGLPAHVDAEVVEG